MSLLHWWPLNGTLEDFGLNGTPLVNNSAALSDNGKFGKCYQCNGTNTFLRTTKPCYEEYTSGQTVTFMCWVKPLTYPSTNGSGIIANNLYLSEAIGSYKGGGFGVCYTTNGQIRIFFNQITAEQSYVIATALPLNTWSHLTISYSNKNAKTYLNGILINDHDFSNDWEISGSVMKIGCGTQGGWNGYGGDKLINDVRIYDNALSQKEVAEIAKGIVTHYNFDNPYCEGTTNKLKTLKLSSYSTYTNSSWDASKHPGAIYTNWGGSGYNSGVADPTHGYHAYYKLDDGEPVLVYQNHNSEIGQKGRWLGISLGVDMTNMPAGTIYTISYDQKVIDSLGGYTTSGIYYKLTSSSSNSFNDGRSTIGSNTEIGVWQHFSRTYTVASGYDHSITTGNLYIYGHYGTESTIYIKNVQLELKDHATPYTENTREESLVNEAGIPQTITNSGSIKIKDMPGFSDKKALFVKSSDTISHSNVLDNSDQEWTCSAWVYPTSNASSTLNNFNSGNYLFYGNGGHQLLYLNSGTNDYYNYGNTVLPLNTWTHITYVFKNSTGTKLIYQNGIEKTNKNGPNKTSTPSGLKTTTICFSGFTGYISDYREYATALTADQVKQLAQTKAQIDDFGNSYSNCLKETQLHNMFESLNESLLTKTYVTGLSSYTQANCQVTFTDDGYRIYRPANHDGSTSRDTWGGLKIDNSENRFNLQEGHTYILKLHVKGKSSNANIIGWTNNMGWGDGGLEPSPTNSSAVSIPSNFNGEMDCFYKWTLSDSLYKVCTSSYSGFVQGNTYLSYKHFQFRYDYTQTGELGTDIYITNFRLYDITNISDKINIQEASILECQDLMENLNNKTKFTQSKTIITNEFKEA